MIVCVMLPSLPLLVALLRRRLPADSLAALAPDPDGPQALGPCTPAAAARGLRAGLRVGEAHARCPELILVPPDPGAATRTLEGLLSGLEGIGCPVEPLEEGAVFDATGVLRLHGGLEGVLARVRAHTPVGASSRVGVAPSRFAAIEAARCATGRRPLVVDRARVADLLEPLPIERLPLDGAACARCRDVGLRTIGQLARLPQAAAIEYLGPAGELAWRLARGEAGPTPRPRPPRHPLRVSLEFDEPPGSLMALRAAARVLLEELAAAARAAGCAIRTLSLEAGLAEGGSWERRVVLREAAADPARLALAALPHLEAIGAPVERLAIEADASASGGGHQLSALPTPEQQRRIRRAEAVRQVRSALGEGALLRLVPLEPDSHLPERRWAVAPHPEPPA